MSAGLVFGVCDQMRISSVELRVLRHGGMGGGQTVSDWSRSQDGG